MKLSRSVALAICAGTFALPAVASAHPGVYTVTQKARKAGTTCVMPDMTCIEDRTQYAVANDGYAAAWTEGNPPTTYTNNAPAGRGLINYKALASGWRGATNNPATVAAVRKSWLQYGPAQTDLQAHATCMGAAWDTEDNRLAWQSDPFYNYIPWQKTSAGIGDDPAKWIALVKDKTGVDLATIADADLPAACATAGGTYYVSDTPAASSISSSQVEDAEAPLKAQVSTLQSQVDQLKNQVGVLEAAAQTQLNASTGAAAALAAAQKAAADAEAGRQALINRPLVASLSAKKFEQAVAMVTGKAGSSVELTMTLSSKDAKKLKLGRTIASKKSTIDAQGAALVELALTKKAAKAIDKHLPALKVTVSATADGVTKTASGTLTR